jgi:plastocyanin
MNKKAIWIVVAAIVIVGGGIGVYALLQQNAGAPSKVDKQSSSDSSGIDPSDKPVTATITYSDEGFSPSKITVKSGENIAIKNASASDMQFDSDPHPVHTNDPELNVDLVSPGHTMILTVHTKGTFGYHNHLNPGDTGTIVVQ